MAAAQRQHAIDLTLRRQNASQAKESGRSAEAAAGARKQGKLLSLASGELFPSSSPERVLARWLSPYFYRFFAAGCRASVRTRVAVHPGPPGVRSEAT